MTPGPPRRTLIVDESLSRRLAAELRARGRDAVTVDALGLRGAADPEVLARLGDHHDAWVLLTADDELPGFHRDAVRRVRATVATISAEREPGWPLDAWRREVVHRWAHVIATQPRGSVRRYALRRHGVWRPRGRRPSVAPPSSA